MDEVEVVVAHAERATLRVGEVFVKVDADQSRLDVEVEAMSCAPVPTPRILWRKPPVLAIAAVAGTTLGRLGGPSTGSATQWAAAGAVIRELHEAPLPPRTGRAGRPPAALAAELDVECDLLVRNGLLPAALVARNRQVAQAALRPWTPAFTHGDLQIAHVFVDGDEVTGIIDWSEAGRGDALWDLATFTLGHEEIRQRADEAEAIEPGGDRYVQDSLACSNASSAAQRDNVPHQAYAVLERLDAPLREALPDAADVAAYPECMASAGFRDIEEPGQLTTVVLDDLAASDQARDLARAVAEEAEASAADVACRQQTYPLVAASALTVFETFRDQHDDELTATQSAWDDYVAEAEKYPEWVRLEP